MASTLLASASINSWDFFRLNAWGYLIVAAVGLACALPALWARPRALFNPLPIAWLRRTRWSGFEVFFIFFLIIAFVPGLIGSILKQGGLLNYIYGHPPDNARVALWSGPFDLLLSVAIIFTSLYYMSRTFPADLGLNRRRWPSNYWLGFFAFLLATPVVLAIQGLLIQFVDEQPHMFQRIAESDTMTVEWMLLLVLACVYAPLIEELLFRGVLLGWLRRAALPFHLIFMTLVGTLGFSSSMPREDTPVNIPVAVFTSLLIVGYAVMLHRLRQRGMFLTLEDFLMPGGLVGMGVGDPVDQEAEAMASADKNSPGESSPGEGTCDESTSTESSPTESLRTENDNPAGAGGTNQEAIEKTNAAADEEESEEEREEEEAEEAQRLAQLILGEREMTPAEKKAVVRWKKHDMRQRLSKGCLAIYGSAMLFSLVHQNWPSCIPLFFLGLVLGWLSHRTQNLVPSILLHVFFNLVGYCVLIIAVAEGHLPSGNEPTSNAPGAPASVRTQVPSSQ